MVSKRLCSGMAGGLTENLRRNSPRKADAVRQALNRRSRVFRSTQKRCGYQVAAVGHHVLGVLHRPRFGHDRRRVHPGRPLVPLEREEPRLDRQR